MQRRQVLAAAMAIGGVVIARQSYAQITQPAPNKTPAVDVTLLARFSPRARADLVTAIANGWPQAISAGINTEFRVAHFLAQTATETGGYRLIAEDMRYSAQRLTEVFPSRVSPQRAAELAYKQVEIANEVYNNRLGNKPPMDGWNYRGSGFIQLTGRWNFRTVGTALGIDLEGNPEIARTPGPAFETAVKYWSVRGVNAVAEGANVAPVRYAVNGGYIGLREAEVWFARALAIIRNPIAKPFEESLNLGEMLAMQGRLRDLGYLQQPATPNESLPTEDANQALRQFQKDRGIPQTGQFDEDVLYELTSPEFFRRN